MIDSPGPAPAFPSFAVACGEEGSNPLVLHEGRELRADEYASSGHLAHLDSDLADVASLGIDVWRYGMPWRMAEPEPQWLDALVGGLDRLSADGQPVRGICWYSRGDQYDWDSALTVPVGTVTEVGLYDAERQPRPVATTYADLARLRRSADDFRGPATS